MFKKEVIAHFRGPRAPIVLATIEQLDLFEIGVT
jgi:hypothetical protein